MTHPPLPAGLSPQQLATFGAIRDKYAGMPVPALGKWRAMSDDDIWLRVVSQVVVVGKEAPAHHLRQQDVRDRLAYARLIAMSPRAAAKAIGGVLASIGTRYVGARDPESTSKVKALVKNLQVLKDYPRGPRGFVRHLAAMHTSPERVAYIGRHFGFMKEKGARDFLTTGLGMASDVIALDSRVMRIATRIVPDLPPKVTTRNYGPIEAFLIEHVCTPLGLSAVQFDQILFHRQAAIEGYLLHGSFPEDTLNLAELSLSDLQMWQSRIAEEIQRRQAVAA